MLDQALSQIEKASLVINRDDSCRVMLAKETSTFSDRLVSTCLLNGSHLDGCVQLCDNCS